LCGAGERPATGQAIGTMEKQCMQSQRKLVQTCLIPIRWGDMDAYGHVNNTIYFRYMEQARVEFLERLGFRSGRTVRRP
jgi:hypothetical protein